MTKEQILALREALQNLVDLSLDIAHAKRVMYEAYLAEGFTPAEALELTKTAF